MNQMANSTAFEVISVVLPEVLLLFICTTFSTVFYSKLENTLWRYVLDFCIIIIPYIFIITIWVPFVLEVYIISFALSLCVILLVYTYGKRNKFKNYHYQEVTTKELLVNIRATINFLTVIAILAVDFKIFPKQFKKQQKYGYSLMDVGVGLFVFANAIVTPEIFNRRVSFKKDLFNAVPLIVLGIGRYIATTLIDYNTSVTEYGKHWNFFITLAMTRLISSVFLKVINVRFSFIFGAIVLLMHEIILQLGVADYVLSGAKRDNFFRANREGIISTVGFIGLYFLSAEIGIWLNVKDKRMSTKLTLLFKLCLGMVLLLPLTLVLENHIGLSRRLANSTYCIWVLFIGVMMTGCCYALELGQIYLFSKFNFNPHVYVTFLFDAINYNGLIFFLVGNLLTGFVNMSCNTLSVGPIISIIILVIYMAATCTVICILYEKKINLKFLLNMIREKSYRV